MRNPSTNTLTSAAIVSTMVVCLVFRSTGMPMGSLVRRHLETAAGPRDDRIGILRREGISIEDAHLVVADAPGDRLVERIVPCAREGDAVCATQIERRIPL